RPAAASLRAPARVALQPQMMPGAAVTPAEQAAQAILAATAVPAEARRADTLAAALAPGGIGLRAEQMAGFVGTRAASLSIDFVDPARLALLSAPAPSMPTVTVAPEARA